MNRWVSRRGVILISLLAILGFFNNAIIDRELLLRSGDVVLLELVPADPRSLMQGDYMRLRYAVAQEAAQHRKEHHSHALFEENKPTGLLVIRLDAKGIARFEHFYAGSTALAAGERLLSYRPSPEGLEGRVVIEPESFFFQEGNADLYAQARYGIMRVGQNGDHLLVGLADEEGREILHR